MAAKKFHPLEFVGGVGATFLLSLVVSPTPVVLGIIAFITGMAVTRMILARRRGL
jgi:hypothetical protein